MNGNVVETKFFFLLFFPLCQPLLRRHLALSKLLLSKHSSFQTLKAGSDRQKNKQKNKQKKKKSKDRQFGLLKSYKYFASTCFLPSSLIHTGIRRKPLLLLLLLPKINYIEPWNVASIFSLYLFLHTCIIYTKEESATSQTQMVNQ